MLISNGRDDLKIRRRDAIRNKPLPVEFLSKELYTNSDRKSENGLS